MIGSKLAAMAWRNLWRNKRRTLITIASIFFGVIIATIMSSFQDGTYSKMIDMSVKMSTGYLQLQNQDFRRNKSINNTFDPSDSLVIQIGKLNEVTSITKRLESFALLSSGTHTRGGAIIGFEPEKDNQISNFQNWINKGEFLAKNDKGVLLTYNIAEYLNLNVNDSLVLISQGYHGVSATGVYPIRGILKFSTPQLNNLGVFMDIGLAQEFYSAKNRVSALMLMVKDYTNVKSTKQMLESICPPHLATLTWKELNPEVVQFIEADRAGGEVMKLILYLVIGFGILGTIIMMVAERRKELGVMIAVGMRKHKLATVLFYETVLIAFVGVIVGFIISIPIIYSLVGSPIQLPPEIAKTYLQYGFEPYMFFGTTPTVFISQMTTVFVIALIIAVYPVIKVNKIQATKALKD